MRLARCFSLSCFRVGHSGLFVTTVILETLSDINIMRNTSGHYDTLLTTIEGILQGKRYDTLLTTIEGILQGKRYDTLLTTIEGILQGKRYDTLLTTIEGILQGKRYDTLLTTIEGILQGKRGRRRPRRTWVDDIREWTGSKRYDQI